MKSGFPTERSFMSGNHGSSCNRDALLEHFAAELTCAAYGVALRHGTAGTWVDLELDLWQALTETVKKWGWGPPPLSEVAFVCDRAEAAHRDGGHGRDAYLPISGE
jgi:hypothetical protein